MPTPRYDFGVCVIGNCIFCIGGWNGRKYLEVVEEYEAEKNTWRTVTPMHTGRCGAAVAVIDHRIWVFGGEGDGGKCLDEIEVFDVEKEEWTTTRIKMTSPRSGAQAVVVDGKIWIIGGVDASGDALNNVEIFDPDTGTWTPAPPLINKRFWHAAVCF